MTLQWRKQKRLRLSPGFPFGYW